MLLLKTELDVCTPDPSQIPDIHDLQWPPYLTALIKEGLRIYSAGPSPLERVVPESRNNEINVLGRAMSARTIIAAHAFSSHRHPGVFVSPELFLPDRWLLDDLSPPPLLRRSTESQPSIASSTASQLGNLSIGNEGSGNTKGATAASALLPSTNQAEMAAHMFPFGHGPRACAGQSLAQMTLRIILSVLARNFDILAPPETNEQSMVIKDNFVAFPAALECRLIFVRRTSRPSPSTNSH